MVSCFTDQQHVLLISDIVFYFVHMQKSRSKVQENGTDETI